MREWNCALQNQNKNYMYLLVIRPKTFIRHAKGSKVGKGVTVFKLFLAYTEHRLLHFLSALESKPVSL